MATVPVHVPDPGVPGYVCRWCGDPLDWASLGMLPAARAHELCGAALGVHGRGTEAEDMLEEAAVFELLRPLRA